MDDIGTQQPGQTVEPARPDSPTPPPSTPDESAETLPPAQESPEPSSAQLYQDEDPDMPSRGSRDIEPIAWTASEFIAHAKSTGWYAGLGVAAVLIAIIIFFMTRDFVSVGVVIFGSLMLGIYAGHQPRQMEYRLDERGLSIGQKHFEYHQFRSFSVIPEGAFSSIQFMPLKRFALPETIYFPPEDEEKIVGLLHEYLPFEERGRDAIDQLMHRIRF